MGTTAVLPVSFRSQTALSSCPFTFLPPSPNTFRHKRGFFAFFLSPDAAASPLSRHPYNNLNRGQKGKSARGQRRPCFHHQGEGVHRHCCCCQRISSFGSSFSTLRTGMGCGLETVRGASSCLRHVPVVLRLPRGASPPAAPGHSSVHKAVARR